MTVRTVIVRVFDPVDGGDGRLHGSVEVPGGRVVPFDGDDELAATVRLLGAATSPTVPVGRGRHADASAE